MPEVADISKRLLLGMLLVLGPAELICADTTWHFPTPISSSAFVTKHHMTFAQRVGSETGGKLTIVVHPGGSLFKASDILRTVRTGQVQIGSTGLFLHSAEDPIFALSEIPFLVSDIDDARLLAELSRPSIEHALAEKNLKLVYTAIWNPTGLFSSQPIQNPADLHGMRIRTYNNTLTRFVQLARGTPTKTETSEIALAFSTSVIDGSFGSGVTGVSQNLWDYIDYYYTARTAFPTSSVVVNLDAWKKLDSETQATVLRIAAETEKAIWSESIEMDRRYNEIMKEAGMTVADVPPQVASHFEQIGRQMLEEWLQESGEEGERIVNRLAAR